MWQQQGETADSFSKEQMLTDSILPLQLSFGDWHIFLTL